jgi:chromosome segregation ATPase
MRGLKHKITRLLAKLKIGKRSTTAKFAEAEHRCEVVERELSDKDRPIEDIQHQLLCLQESVDTHTVQMEVTEMRASASTKQVAALDSQLFKTQVNWKLRIRLKHLYLANCSQS